MRYGYLVLVMIAVLLVAGCTTSNSVTGNAVGTSQVKDIEIKGSDTLLQLVSNMAEAYSEVDPSTRVSVTGGGSGSGIAALINGEIDVADASRPIKAEEIEQAKAGGTTPFEVTIARDMLSIVVNPSNPISKLTIEQISKIYSGEITNWKEVGGSDQPITLYGRQSTSGTYVFFQEDIIKAEYSPKMRNMEGNQAILDAVRQDKTGVGYVGIGYLVDESGNEVSGIKIVNVAKDAQSEYQSPMDESKHATYPVARSLFQYIAGKPAKGSAIYDFAMFELSDEGQEIVKESGFVPLSIGDRNKMIAALG